MTKFISLSSGSNGNCYYIGNEQVSFLIDLGIGGRTIKKRLTGYDIAVDTIDFVLVTHDHVDHIKSLGSFTERFHKPVFATEKLHKSLEYHFCTRGKLIGCVKDIRPGEPFECLGVKIISFSVPHDAHDTVGYYIDFFGTTFTFITDVGNVTDDVVKYCKMAEHLVLESNYDVDMLINGKYTPDLKLRIMNGNGHLSNEQAASIIKRAVGKQTQSLFLCHLSENNNTPQLALSSAQEALKLVSAEHVLLQAMPRRTASQVFEF